MGRQGLTRLGHRADVTVAGHAGREGTHVEAGGAPALEAVTDGLHFAD